MESFGQKARAYLYAFLVHVLVALSLIFGLFFADTAKPVATPGPIIEATIVGVASAPRPRAQSKPRPEPPKPVAPAPAPEPPKPEPPKPPEVQPPPTVQHDDSKEQEKIAEMADQKAEAAKRAQEEKHRKQQIELDEEKKREEAEAKQKAAKQAEIQQKLDDIRKEREKAAKQTLLAKEKMKRLDDLQKQQSEKKSPPADVPESDTPKTGMNGNDSSKSAEYYSAIQLAVTNNWLRPDNAPPGLSCRVHIIQIPGGTVISATVVPPCNVDVATKTSIQQAVMKASPLPYKSYEKEFKREINFDFSYDGR